MNEAWNEATYERLAGVVSPAQDDLLARLVPREGERWLVEALGPQPLRERRRSAHALGGRIREEIAHGASMLRAWR